MTLIMARQSGTWITIGVNISDDVNIGETMFADHSMGLVKGTSYFYRIRAKSEGGFSDWSNVVCAKATKNTWDFDREGEWQ